MNAAQPQDLFSQALACQQQGRPLQARGLCERVLAQQPQHADALQLLGLIAAQMGSLESAADFFGRAIAARPVNPAAHYNRGVALQELRQPEAALACYDRTIRLQPDFMPAYLKRGVVLQELGQLDAALASYDRAIALRPDFADAYLNRGNVLALSGRWQEALAGYQRAIAADPRCARAYLYQGRVLRGLGRPDDALRNCDRAVEISPDDAEAHFERAVVLWEQGQLEGARAGYEQAIRLRPGHAEAHSNLGLVLHELNRVDDALASFEAALAIMPRLARTWSNRGALLQECDRFEEALESFDRAIAVNPSLADAHSNRGNVLLQLQCPRPALQSLDRAVALSEAAPVVGTGAGIDAWPGSPEAIRADAGATTALHCDHAAIRYNRSLALLASGDYENGWREHEWRWRTRYLPGFDAGRTRLRRHWLGREDIAGRRILLHGEQGLGDTLQFCRYVRLVKELGAYVILEVEPALMSLLRGMEGVDQIVSPGAPLPEFDFYCSLMSLPLALKTTLSTVPGQVPYLAADPEKVRVWRQQLGEPGRRRVGLVWSGGFRPQQPKLWSLNRRRNIPLVKFAPLAGLDIGFYSLQKGQPAESELVQAVSDGWNGPEITDFAHSLQDFSDTAALIQNLDLILSVDTSTAHLAGALGKPVWLMNRFDTCWRWLLDGTGSPWYPTFRIFRQPRPGDWDAVVRQVREELGKPADSRR